MILIVGKNEELASCVAAKFRDMHFGGEVQVRNSTRLLDFLNNHHGDVEMLFFVDKRHLKYSEDLSRVEHLQQLWSMAAKYAIPLFFLFFKYSADYSVDSQIERFVSWTGKQYRKPPFHYLFLIGELYGIGDKESVVDCYCRRIIQTGVIEIGRHVVDGVAVERQLDYIYVQDLLRVLYWFAVHRPENGVYELGCGFSRRDSAVAAAIFRALKLPLQIRLVENEDDVSASQSCVMTMDLSHLRRVGYKKPFYSVESGMKSYIHYVFRTGGFF